MTDSVFLFPSLKRLKHYRLHTVKTNKNLNVVKIRSCTKKTGLDNEALELHSLRTEICSPPKAGAAAKRKPCARSRGGGYQLSWELGAGACGRCSRGGDPAE